MRYLSLNRLDYYWIASRKFYTFCYSLILLSSDFQNWFCVYNTSCTPYCTNHSRKENVKEISFSMNDVCIPYIACNCYACLRSLYCVTFGHATIISDLQNLFSLYTAFCFSGEMAEWLNALDSKSSIVVFHYREFESPSLRHETRKIRLKGRVLFVSRWKEGFETAGTRMNFEKVNSEEIPLNGDFCAKAFRETSVRCNRRDISRKESPSLRQEISNPSFFGGFFVWKNEFFLYTLM